MRKLFIDLETYSSVDLKKSGLYRYAQSPDFEILLICFAVDGEPVQCVDCSNNQPEGMPFLKLAKLVRDCKLHAHNAAFERICLNRYGFTTEIEDWFCTMVQAAYAGLPLSLGDVSEALKLEKGKMTEGKELVKFFCQPCKPTKVNGMRTRNTRETDPEKWQQFIEYCKRDVEAEREIYYKLESYNIPQSVQIEWQLDQRINDRGILIDLDLAKKAIEIDKANTEQLSSDMVALTGLNNPNSAAQVKAWLTEETGSEVESLNKKELPKLLEGIAGDRAKQVLELRTKLAKSSVKKYTAMINCACEDNRARGLFQFYGANRTGRWAGRLIQLQNLPQNHLANIEQDRETIKTFDYDTLTLFHDDIGSLLSQLIRTAFVPAEGRSFVVVDFSAIEARVLAWLAKETWRLDVFRSHGKIYEASAAMMFKVPIDSITKGSDLRQKGKVAELALGYQGSLGALKQMGGEQMGLSENEMYAIAAKWRQANPNIVRFWGKIETMVKQVLVSRKSTNNIGLVGDTLYIELPSKRRLYYQKAHITTSGSIGYWGTEGKKWSHLDTYGGKLTENIVQAISRDILAEKMLRLQSEGAKIVMHVHDEIVLEVPTAKAKEAYDRTISIMREPISWAKDLPLDAAGFISNFYKKD